MGIFKKLNMFGEIEEEAKFYSHEYFKKTKRLIKVNTENIKLAARVEELEKENEELKTKIEKLEKGKKKNDKNRKSKKSLNK
jgi:cell division protein FtsB